MQFKRALIAVSISVPLALFGGPVAHAAEGNPTGGGWDPGTSLQRSQAEINDLQNKMADADYDYHQLACDDAPNAPCPNVPDTKSIAMNHVAQSTNYYCGPAAGVMILRASDEGASAYNGDSLNQPNVAKDAHMETDTNGKTAWASGRFRRGLNRWRGDTEYANLPSPTNKQLRSILHKNIKKGLAFGASTVEFAGGAHYNFHPSNQLIGHWIVVRGWKSSLDSTMFADPAANSAALSSAWSSVEPKFTAKTNSFNQSYLQTNGVTV